jgi:regulatory protein
MMNVDRAKSYAIKLLSYRMYTVSEMSDKLMEKCDDEDVTNEVLFELCKSKLLDDMNYATLYIQDSISLKQKGRFRIQMELQEKGVDKSVIRQAFASSEVDEFAALLDYIEKYTSGKVYETYNDIEKLKAHLYRKGYAADDISRAVRESGL